jgi:hypothetical protein
VFISHRGPDTKTTFVDGLRRELPGRRVFVDEYMDKGVDNWATIKSTLDQARVVVLVLSPGYHESPWCLEEMRLAFEAGKETRVIFFNTTPGQVDKLNLKPALRKAQQSSQLACNQDLLSKWQAALAQAKTVVAWEYPLRVR